MARAPRLFAATWLAAALSLVVIAFAVCDGKGPTKPQDDAGATPGPDGSAPLAPDPSCTTDGCLREATKVGDYSKAALAPYLQAGVSIDNGYSVWTLRLWTDGRETLATVTVPYPNTPPPGGWHIVANDHGTVGLDDPCVVAGTVAGAGLAGTFGARGFIGVAPEYPGLGTPGIEPYLVSDVEAHAVFDALRATRQLANWKGWSISNRFAVVGLSQGGHATLAAAADHAAYAPDLDVRAFSAAAPASAWEEQWRAAAQYDGAFLEVHAMLMYAWANFYHFNGPNPWSDSLAPMIDYDMTHYCTFSSTGAPTFDQAGFPTTGSGIFSPDFLAAYRSGNWGAFAAFHEYFAKNRIGPYAQTAPIKIWQGDADDTVPQWTTDQLVAALRAGGDTVEYEVVPGANHTDLCFGFVAYQEYRTNESIQWIRSHLDQ